MEENLFYEAVKYFGELYHNPRFFSQSGIASDGEQRLMYEKNIQVAEKAREALRRLDHTGLELLANQGHLVIEGSAFTLIYSSKKLLDYLFSQRLAGELRDMVHARNVLQPYLSGKIDTDAVTRVQEALRIREAAA